MKPNKKNILIISIYFPPIISIASYRILSFAKYLDKNLFNIFIITLDSGPANPQDDIPSHIKVYRIKNKALFKRLGFNTPQGFLVHKMKAAYNKLLALFIRDEYYGWENNAAKKASEIIKQENISVILSSFPPLTPHSVGLRLKKSFPHLKWIADMRDEMALNPSFSTMQRKYFKKIENKIFQTADLITTTTFMLRSNFTQNAKGLVGVGEVKNGFDFDIVNQSKSKNSTFTITHAGTFYGENKPYKFLHAVERLISKGIIPDIQVNFIGSGHSVLIPKTLKNQVLLTPKIPHHEALQYISCSDALLLVIPPSIRGALPGKLFEYMASGKPIIALLDINEEAAQILTQCGTGLIANETVVEEIEAVITKAYKLWKEGEYLKSNTKFVEKFHRKEQAKILQNLILTMCDSL